MRRAVYTVHPTDGDYVLSPTGFSWNVGRSNGDGSVRAVIAGTRDRSVAVSHLVALASADQTDAWQAVTRDSFRLLRGCRPSPTR